MKMYRQGDILIVEISIIPDNLESSKSNVIAEGEITGHCHRLDENSDVFVGPTGDLYFEAKKDSDLVHDEHDTITIPEGTYKVIRQREYDEGEIRYVSD